MLSNPDRQKTASRSLWTACFPKLANFGVWLKSSSRNTGLMMVPKSVFLSQLPAQKKIPIVFSTTSPPADNPTRLDPRSSSRRRLLTWMPSMMDAKKSLLKVRPMVSSLRSCLPEKWLYILKVGSFA